MTTNFYFTHPIASSFDPRINALEEKLHGKGYSLYWYIREKLSYFPQKCCRLEDLKPFATKYYTYRLMKQVVLESGLFEIEKGYIIPLKLECEGGTIDEEVIHKDTTAKPKRRNKTSRKNSRAEAKNSFAFIISDDNTESKNSENESKNSRKRTKNSENPSVSDENPLKNDENPSKNSGKQAENDEKRAIFDEKQAVFDEKQAFFDGKQAKNSGKQVRKTSQGKPEYIDKQTFVQNLFETSNTNTSIYIKKEREKEKKYISSTEKEKEEEKEKAENAVNSRNVPVQHHLPPRAATEKTPHLQQPSHPQNIPSAPPPLHVLTTVPCVTNVCNVWNRSTGKKPPHLPHHPLGFAGTLPRICPENPRGIGHKARDNPTIWTLACIIHAVPLREG